MRNLKIEQSQKDQLPKLGVLTNLTELSRYNYIYVHHLIKDGDTLKMQRDYKRTWDTHSLAVFFKGYKIGYLSNAVNKIISRHFELNKEIEIVVKQVNSQSHKRNINLDVVIKIG